MSSQPASAEQVSRLVALFLKGRGVDRVYGLCGGHIQPIWDQIASLGIRIIDVRDEGAAVHMAHAHSDLSGTLGVALVTAGPGVTNAVTGIANAFISRVPLLVISACPPRPQYRMAALQDIPHVEMLRPITRYAQTVVYPRHALRQLDDAVAWAEGHFGEPGPVFIDFPVDVLRETVAPPLVETSRCAPREAPRFISSPDAVDAAVNLLWSARRPLVISGRDARGSEDALRRLLDALGCAYLDTTESRGLIPDDHPAIVPAIRGRVMSEADVVLTVGRSLDYQLGYGSPAVFGEARFVRIGSTWSELRDNRPGDVEVFGRPSQILDAMVTAAGGRSSGTDRSWISEIRALDRKRREDLAAQLGEASPGADGRMHPYRLLGSIRERLAPDALVIADGGDILSFSRVVLTGFQYLDCGAFGCLGVGVPFGVAASLLYPERQVLVITGDGAFGFNAMELDTCVRHRARTVFVVANNRAWNIDRNDQIMAYGGRTVGVDLDSGDYAGVARALGLYSEQVTDPSGLPSALQRAFDRAPALLDVAVTRSVASPDALSGLVGVPDFQPLKKWDDRERERETDKSR